MFEFSCGEINNYCLHIFFRRISSSSSLIWHVICLFSKFTIFFYSFPPLYDQTQNIRVASVRLIPLKLTLARSYFVLECIPKYRELEGFIDCSVCVSLRHLLQSLSFDSEKLVLDFDLFATDHFVVVCFKSHSTHIKIEYTIN